MADSSDGKAVASEIESRQPREVQEGLSGVTATGEFKSRSVRGGAAAVVGQSANMALTIGTTIVLAHLLSPSDYGLQGMVFSLTAICSLFKDAGLNAATIQRENLTHEQISAVFWINLALGAALMLVVAGVAPLLAAFYREPRVLWITVASATIFLFNALSVQHSALLNRAMRFTTSAKIDVFSCSAGTVVAIGMALLGCGYWSLIAQNIAIPLVGAAAMWIAMPWLPARPSRSVDVRPLMRFGGTVTLNGVVVYFAYNTEKILLGRFWGADALGIYGRAYQLGNLPLQGLTNAVGSVAFPVLSRMQSDAQLLRRSFLKFHSVVVSLTIPVVITCALFADEIVRVLLGAKWMGAVPVVRLLAPTFFVFAVMNPLSWIVRAKGLVRRSLNIALVLAPVVILGIVAGLRNGPPGVALGYSTAMVLLAVPLIAWAKHGTGITFGDYWDCIKRPFAAGVLGGLAGWLVQFFFKEALTPLPLLALEMIAFSAVYAGLLFFVMGQKDFYVDLARHILRPSEASALET